MTRSAFDLGPPKGFGKKRTGASEGGGRDHVETFLHVIGPFTTQRNTLRKKTAETPPPKRWRNRIKVLTDERE